MGSCSGKLGTELYICFKIQTFYNRFNFYQVFNKMEVQSESDSWDPQPQINLYKPTLFNKVIVHFNDAAIDQNINQLCQKPILQQELQDFQSQEFQFGQRQTQQQPQNQLFGKTSEHKQMKEQKTKEKQAMYDALQDDENYCWIKKNMLKGKQIKRPLTCPNCFTQLCYNYNSYLTQDGQKGYQTQFPQNIQICANKIIRNRNSQQIISQKKNMEQSLRNADQDGSLKILQQMGQLLKQRYEEINVKIICKCNQCELQLGYFDVNRQAYVIFNVI